MYDRVGARETRRLAAAALVVVWLVRRWELGSVREVGVGEPGRRAVVLLSRAPGLGGQAPWKFEAFDGEWRELYCSQVDPCFSPRPGHLLFPVRPRDAFASSRFRLRLAGVDGQCMHVRGLELFGTILPPWRL